MLTRTLEAAEAHGVSAEVVDLRSLRPLDTATIVAPVSRTRRAEVAMRIVDAARRLVG